MSIHPWLISKHRLGQNCNPFGGPSGSFAGDFSKAIAAVHWTAARRLCLSATRFQAYDTPGLSESAKGETRWAVPFPVGGRVVAVLTIWVAGYHDPPGPDGVAWALQRHRRRLRTVYQADTCPTMRSCSPCSAIAPTGQ